MTETILVNKINSLLPTLKGIKQAQHSPTQISNLFNEVDRLITTISQILNANDQLSSINYPLYQQFSLECAYFFNYCFSINAPIEEKLLVVTSSSVLVTFIDAPFMSQSNQLNSYISAVVSLIPSLVTFVNKNPGHF